MKETQISAYISQETKDELEKLTRERGLKKGFVLEQALLYYMRAVRDLPDEALIPPRLVVTRASFEKILERFESAPKPSAALKRLMNGKPIPEDGLH